MPPITGALGADFASFDAAVQKSVVALKGFETGGAKVEGALTRMSNSLSGTKIIQEATIAAEAVERVGGVSTLTARELGRVQATAQEAAEKLRALGQEVPPGIDRLARSLDDVGAAAGGTDPKVANLQGSLNKFNGVLAAAGLQVGPEIAALGELGEVSGKTATQIGALGVAGLAFGAAVGGWKIGRAVAEFFDLDTKIGDATAALMGFGDMAGQVAGAKQDVINLAITRGADAMVSYTDALKHNAAWLANSKAGHEALATKVKIVEDAIWANYEKMAQAATQAAAKVKAAHDVMVALQDRLFGRDLITRAGEYVTAIGPLSNLSKVAADEQGRINTLTWEGIAAFTRHGQVAPQAMRDLYMATLPLPPIVTGLDNLVGKLGASVDLAIPKFRDFAKETAAFNAETQRLAEEGIGSVVTKFGQAEQAATSGAAANRDYSVSLIGMSDAAQQAWDALSKAEQVLERLKGTAALDAAGRAATQWTGNVGINTENYNRTIQSFAGGGVGDFGSGTLAMLHGKEAIVPLSGGGIGTSVTLAAGAIQIVVGAGGSGAQAGRAAADALLRRLEQRGVRV